MSAQARPARNHKTSCKTEAAAFADNKNAVDASSEKLPKDPAHVAAAVLLRRALADAGTTSAVVGRDGSVCIVSVPRDEWVEPVCEEWSSDIRDGEGWSEGTVRYHENRKWFVWKPLSPPMKTAQTEASELFALAVTRGRHCLGVSSDLTWLPDDLVHAADHRLVLPTMEGADLAVITERLTGAEPTKVVSDEEAALLTPRLLRLARRPGQGADDYISRLRDLMGRERSRATAVPAAPKTLRDAPTLVRLHGMDEAVAWGSTVARDLKAFRSGSITWADIDRGCLLSGPPGSGKTLFARALAATCGVPLVTGGYGRWHGAGNGHQGDMLKAMQSTFALARTSAPSILFIDEIDSFPDRASLSSRDAAYMIPVVNALLAEVDGVEAREGVILLGACNHPNRLDSALIRSGRLDRHIRIRLPDQQALDQIFREHLGGDLLNVSISTVTLSASGLSGADCERIVRSARRRAREARRAMQVEDLMAEVGGDGGRTEEELWWAAVHEAGHALAACIWHPGRLRAISLRADSDAFGETQIVGSNAIIRAADVRCHLATILAGRAAEEVIFGHPSSGSGGGATSDLALATRFAVMASTAFGLDATTGLVWSGMPERETLSAMLAADPALAVRVRTSLGDAYADALTLIRRRRAVLEELAKALVERRALNGETAAAIVASGPDQEWST